MTAGGCGSRVSAGPFIDTTPGQMAAADNRPVYEVYLCGHQELKCIEAGNGVVTEGPPPPETKWALWAPGVERNERVKALLEWLRLA